MTRLSNWREESDLFEVVTGKMTDEKALKKVDEKKGIKNKIVINPKLTEAIKELGGELIEATEEDENGDTVDPRKEAEKKSEEQKKKQIENKQKRAQMIKKQVLMKKLIAVRQGSEDIVAGYEPEGEIIEGSAYGLWKGDGKRKLPGDKPKGMENLPKGSKVRVKKGVKVQGKYVKEASVALAANNRLEKAEKRKRNEKEYARLMAILAHQKDLKKRGLGEEVVTERLGGKGYSKQAAASSVYPGKKGTGDWEDSDRGAGNKAARRAGKKVEKKSPTYLAHVHNKEGYESKKTGEVLAAFKRDPKVRKRFEKAARKDKGPGSVENQAADDMLRTAKDTAKRKGDTSKSDDRYAYEEVVHEATRYKKEKGYDKGGTKKPSGKKDAALSAVVSMIRSKHGKGAIVGQGSRQQKKVKGAKSTAGTGKYKRAADEKKQLKKDAKEMGYGSDTKGYIETRARYGSKENMKSGRGLGT